MKCLNCRFLKNESLISVCASYELIENSSSERQEMFYFVPSQSLEEIEKIWANEIPHVIFHEMYYDTMNRDLFQQGTIVIHRHYLSGDDDIWIVQSDYEFNGKSFEYTQLAFQTKEQVEEHLECKLEEQSFCWLRVHRYRKRGHYWIDISMRIWEDLSEPSLCYVVASSTIDPGKDKKSAPSNLVFFFSKEHNEEFNNICTQYNWQEEAQLMKKEFYSLFVYDI